MIFNVAPSLEFEIWGVPSIKYRPDITVAYIQRIVARHYDIPLAEMTSARRQRDIARPRQEAMYLAHRFTGKSLPNLGRHFGNRDHTTILHGIRSVKERIKTNSRYAAMIEMLAERVQAA
jgi:chromosomal replication initiator protein